MLERKEKEKITRERILAAFRALREKGIQDPEDYENSEVVKAQKLLDAWVEQEEAASADNTEQRLRMALSHATILIDAGFVDPVVNRPMLEDRVDWLVQDYDNAVEEKGLEKLAQEILERIHQINDILGEKRYDPAELGDNPVGPITTETSANLFEERVNKVKGFCQVLLERPDDPEANEQLRDILKSEAFVNSLTNELPSRGYVDARNNRGYTFIKMTEEISFYGESDSNSFKFDKIEIITTVEARKRISQMETDKNLTKEHEL